MEKLIGLIGFKQSGKSTAASYLESKYGFVRHNFKDGLKLFMVKTIPDVLEWCRLYYQMTNEELFDKKPPLFRLLMANIGTDLIRHEISNNFWVDIWRKKQFAGVNTVADDVRFLNEAQAIKRRGGILIRIIRTDITTGGDHSSETEQLQIEADYTIEVGHVEHDKLYAELDAILKACN